jgi:hypothetical protein
VQILSSPVVDGEREVVGRDRARHRVSERFDRLDGFVGRGVFENDAQLGKAVV